MNSRSRTLRRLAFCLAIITPLSAQAISFGPAVNLGPAINSAGTDSGASISSDGLTLYFQSDRSGTRRIYKSTRSSTTSGWSVATEVTELNAAGFNTGAPTLSTDGLSIYFNSNRNGNTDIYKASRSSVTNPWGPVNPLGIVNTLATEGGPEISADGLTMYFHRMETNGPVTATSIYKATRSTNTGTNWQNATVTRMGARINSIEHAEAGPSISSDGNTLFFHSSRPGTGFYDLYMATWNAAEGKFNPAVELAGLNTAGFEGGAEISFDGRTLFFTSDRGGSRDIYMATAVVPEPSTWLLMLAGLGGLLLLRRKQAA